MNTELSPNTQAILLLTAPLIVGKSRSSARPLSLTEYGNLAQALLEGGRQPADLLQPGAEDVLRECRPDFDDGRISQLLERGFLLSQALERWRARAIWVISRADSDYPERFRRRLGGLAPPVLYGCGDVALIDNGGLAVVGSRSAAAEALEYADSTGRLAASAQCAIVSGGARGVDHAAMHGALSAWGTAVGVLADRLEKAAMERGNRDVLMDGQLVLVSPYDPNAGFNVGNAMQRNKLVYALADAGLVIESDYNKGGTWAGAVEQLDKLHLVPIYARTDGSISKGISALHKKGARPWPSPQTADDFRAVIAGKWDHTDVEAIHQSAFSLEGDELAEPHDDSDTGEIVRSISDTVLPSVPEITLSDRLLASVEQLLETIDKPITASDVAERLDVSKKQAGDWLKRLEQAGKYQRRNKRAPYERVNQVRSLL